MSESATKGIGVVVIGRNEGQRLRRCLESVAACVDAIVCVDSGSTDGSVELARSLGANVVALDLSQPFTAARSRNAGIARLREIDCAVEFVQVVDGDCEIVAGWMARALDEMRTKPRAGIVCGRRRERHPEASVYNRLCDMEWNTPVGEAESCGGDALIRLCAFDQVGGYDPSIIAGEEPEMCLRMRQAGWTIQRIDHEMTLHDAQMTHLSQWWKRAVRSGHAYAQGRVMHGSSAQRFCVREVRSIVEWTVVLPLLAIGLVWFTWGASLLLLAAYGLLWYRVRGHRLQHGDSPEDASLYANYCIAGKFAQMHGMNRYWWNRLRGRQTRLIEYKGADAAPQPSAKLAEAGKP